MNNSELSGDLGNVGAIGPKSKPAGYIGCGRLVEMVCDAGGRLVSRCLSVIYPPESLSSSRVESDEMPAVVD